MPVFESIEIRRKKENDPAAEGELVCRIDAVGITLYAGSVFTQNAVAPAIFSVMAANAPEAAAVSEPESPAEDKETESRGTRSRARSSEL